MIRTNLLLIINLILLVTFSSCKNDSLNVNISDIDLEIKIERFDREIFTMDFDTINESVAYYYNQYGDFFDIFNVHVINIGPASQKYYGSYLSMFVNDPNNFEVFEYTQQVFDVTTEIDRKLTDAFKRYKYHYPDSVSPRIVGYVSRFNHKIFTVSEFVGLGLDQYLGADCEYYDLLGTPEYMQLNMQPANIPSDVAGIWASALYPFNDSVNNLLNNMIYKGMLLYFTDMLLPGEPDSLKIGFSREQMRFCRNNEKQMWTYLIEHDLLFSTDQLEITKLTEDAPTTYYFPKDSPGRACVWLGWQIVREFARRNPDMSPPEIMEMRDYQSVLRGARYTP